MKIQLLSDIHLEFDDGVENFSLPKTDADLIVLAGDIGLTSEKYFDWVLNQTDGKQAVMVLGNHEFYRDRINNVKNRWADALKGTHVSLLDNDYIDIGNYRVIGGTLWTNFLLDGFCGIEHAMEYVNYRMNDYRMIRVDENIEEPEDIGRLPYLDAPTTYEYFKVSYEFFKQSILDLEQSDSTKRSIIVSHHAPSPKSLINFRHEDKVKNAYASNLEPFMRRFKPVLWMHGHHHQSIDYQVDQTRIISNPRGYSPDMLNRHFDPSLVIEI